MKYELLFQDRRLIESHKPLNQSLNQAQWARKFFKQKKSREINFKIFHESDSLISRVFFAWTLLDFLALCSGLEIKVNKSKRQQYCTDNGIAYEFDNECVPIVNQVLKSNVKIEK